MAVTFVVERIWRLSGRRVLLLSGMLDGGELRIGAVLSGPGGEQIVIRAIEFHSRPGTTTIGVDPEFAETLREGAVLTGASGR